ncbi:hypothetical protein SAFG77S_00639 [Streptomyces afghaniensis]
MLVEKKLAILAGFFFLKSEKDLRKVRRNLPS